MKVRIISACVSTALFISLSASTAFADVSLVTTRAALNGTDTINWIDQGDGDTGGENGYLSYLVDPNFGTNPNLYLPNVMSDNGMMIAVAQSALYYGSILLQPSAWLPYVSNLPAGDYILSTQISSETTTVNPFTFTFSDANGPDICGFGTQSAVGDPGGFTAQLQAFDGNGSLGSVQVYGSTTDTDAKFIGISSTTPMTSLEFSIESSGSGAGRFLASYVINHVTLTSCSDEPVIPAFSCEGFAAPMADYPVKAKKNRAFPLKMKLFDDGFELTDGDLAAAPVVTVLFNSSEIKDAVDIGKQALSSRLGSDGNQFEYTDDGIWQFNLKSKNYKASGTYVVTVDSGDESEYTIDSSCVTSFIIK